MYDLLIRDATIVTSGGRQVADVAIQRGRIRYVGPRPPRPNAKREIHAIGKFLMPGVVDTAARFGARPTDDWGVESGAAVTGGITTAMALPAPDSSVGDAEAKLARLARTSWCNYGLWGHAASADLGELARAIEAGLYIGALASIGSESEAPVALEDLPSVLALPGLLGLQLDVASGDKDTVTGLFDSLRGTSRATHLMHVSTALELDLLDPLQGELSVTAGVTPHHLFLASEEVGQAVKTHPPIRPEHDRRTLWTAVKRGRLDCVASDHHNNAQRGVPGAELLFPLMLSAVKYGRLSLELLVSLCAEAPARVCGLESKGRIVKGADADLLLFSEGEVARVDESSLKSGAGWSPYLDREVAPKPEFVILGGEIVAQRGELVGKKPSGTHALDR